MNLLDENIIEDQRELLVRWRIRTRQIGQDVGQQGMKDHEHLLPLLHKLSRPTFFTRDLGFYNRQLCHDRYCVVCLAVHQYEVARFMRRLLRHSRCNTWSKRQGTMMRVSHAGIRRFRLNYDGEELLEWES